MTNNEPTPDPESRGHIGWIVAGSLASGLVAALLLAAAPFIPAEVSAVSGAVLCGFAFGWAMLVVLSVRFTDQPQRWATAPALFMGVSGLLLLGFGSSMQDALSWVWPPALLGLLIWMVLRIRRELSGSRSRWLLYAVIALTALACVGGGYETVQAAADDAFPAPGQLVDIGGRKLHLNCTGSGSPTVVLQAGGGEMSSAFGWIAPTVADDTRVCVYDRAGHGWSEPADTAQDALAVAADLHTLLERGDVPGPYVMAGHSFGGLYTLAYAARYADDVAGMVLVDSTAPASEPITEGTSSDDPDSYHVMDHVSALLGASARLGSGRLIGGSDFGSLPPQSRDEMRAFATEEDHLRSTVEEYLQASTSTGQAATLDDFGDKPLFVLTAAVGSDATWMANQDELATLSTNTAHSVIEGAKHAALIHDEEFAAGTGQAILDVVSAVRSGTPLSE